LHLRRGKRRDDRWRRWRWYWRWSRRGRKGDHVILSFAKLLRRPLILFLLQRPGQLLVPSLLLPSLLFSLFPAKRMSLVLLLVVVLVVMQRLALRRLPSTLLLTLLVLLVLWLVLR
jgi:hypothetical protein